jgi:dienelactone hydrolase
MLLWVGLIAIALPVRADSSMVKIPATMKDGTPVELDARLTMPEAAAGTAKQYPAVILLHGCNGTDLSAARSDTAFKGWPYAFLAVDSFDARGISHACEGYKAISPTLRALDAHAARAWLEKQPDIDPNRIAVLGWSMGGETVLAAVSNPDINEPPRTKPFTAAVAFYPYCPVKLRNLDAPLLVLTGGEDDWTPPGTCRSMQITGDSPPAYERIEYPGATHAFDWQEAPPEMFGHKMRYDPAATEDAYLRVRAFLDKNLQ